MLYLHCMYVHMNVHHKPNKGKSMHGEKLKQTNKLRFGIVVILPRQIGPAARKKESQNLDSI